MPSIFFLNMSLFSGTTKYSSSSYPACSVFDTNTHRSRRKNVILIMFLHLEKEKGERFFKQGDQHVGRLWGGRERAMS